MSYCLSEMSIQSIENAVGVFQETGGVLRTKDALAKGIHSQTLYRMRDEGHIEKVSRGFYKLTGKDLINYDFTTVALRAPKAVVCLISACAFHEITVEIPRFVYIALPRGANKPKIDWPKTRVFYVSGEAYSAGIVTHDIAGIKVKIYDPEKTIVDCFKFRNKIGMAVAIDALKTMYEFRGKKMSIKKLSRYSQICRVQKVMSPYIQMLTQRSI